jgi:Outer membrane protein beta-barrel domain
MIRKFVTVSTTQFVQGLILVTMLAGAAAVRAQQDPAAQTPSQQPQKQQPPQTEPEPQSQSQDHSGSQPPSQQPSGQQPGNQQSSSEQSSSQEPSEEIGMRKPKPKEYKNWSFTGGGGASLTRGTTGNFVRSGGGIAAASVARNANKYLGLRLDFQFNNLPLRASALQSAGSTGGNAHVYTWMLGPIVNIPVSKAWGGYVLGGVSFLHRTGALDSSSAIPGSACNPFFLWWGHCFNGSLPLFGQFLHASQNEWGENFGGGITHRIRPNMEIYAEYRFLHGSHDGITTDLRPITVGIRF